ncbi:MAG: hypothetical protein WAU68_04110 [Vitreimonas sp.]
MSWTSISEAHVYWSRRRTETKPPSNLEAAETYILSAHPVTNEDAACILDVVCANNGDPRCDGLDRTALARIRAFLSRAA